MSEQLRRNLDDLDALVTQTAAARGLPAPYVEKDFWVTEVLRTATTDRIVALPDGSTAPVTFLFKGGTSLSRVFGIVDRFSGEGVLLELGTRGGIYPTGSHSYSSMVADYATTELGEAEDTWEEFTSFTVNVLAPERTLLEKIAALHDATVRGDTATLLRNGQHFYGIDRLLNTATVTDTLDALHADGFAELVEDINAHSAEAGFTWSPRPEGGYATSPAFDPQADIREAIRTDFDAAQALIHGTRISLDDVITTVLANRERL